MFKKLFTFFAALTLSAGLWADEPAITDITITGDKYVGTELMFAATVSGFSADPMIIYEVKAEGGEYEQAQGGKFTPAAAGNYTVKAAAFYLPSEGDAEEASKEVNFTVTEAPAPVVAESVDLGLPSGLKWATFNVGATTPEGYGDYFAWGETEPYYNTPITDPITWKSGKESGYDWQSYCGQSSFKEWDPAPYDATTKILTPEYDAATANWGSDWRMPTKAEQDELISNCDWTWTTDYNGTGVAGYIVQSKAAGNNNSIFLPASGYRSDSSLLGVGSDGYYWSSSLYEGNSNYAYCLYFLSVGVGLDYYDNRYYGLPVRPVYDPSEPTALPTLKNADKAPVRKYIKNGRFEMEINGKKYNALGF